MGAAGTPRRRRRAGEASEGHWGRKLAEGRWRAAARIQGRWTIGGSEPCRVCGEDGEKTGSKNLLERRMKGGRAGGEKRAESVHLHL